MVALWPQKESLSPVVSLVGFAAEANGRQLETIDLASNFTEDHPSREFHPPGPTASKDGQCSFWQERSFGIALPGR